MPLYAFTGDSGDKSMNNLFLDSIVGWVELNHRYELALFTLYIKS